MTNLEFYKKYIDRKIEWYIQHHSNLSMNSDQCTALKFVLRNLKRPYRACSKRACRTCLQDSLDWLLEEHKEQTTTKAISHEKETKTIDSINHPQHYEINGMECIDVLLATQGKEAVKSFCICNAIKYLYRWKNKNGAEDIKKANWYINKFLELEKELEEDV